MRCRIIITKASKAKLSPPSIFGVCLARQESRWRAGAGSVLTHALIGAAIFGLTPQPEFRILLSPSGESLMLRVPEPLYIPRDLSARDRRPISGAPTKRRSVSDTTPGKPRRPAARPVLSAHLELPAPPVLSQDGSVLLQPRLAPQATIPPPVPPLAFWSRQRPPAVRPKLVIPGRLESAAPLPEVGPPPQLDIPNREELLAQINMAADAIVPQPALPAPPSATTPVRIFRPPASQPAARAGTLDPFEGEPAQVLSASAPVYPLDRIVAVPAGSAAPLRNDHGDSGLDGRDPRNGRGAGPADLGKGSSPSVPAEPAAEPRARVPGAANTREGSLPAGPAPAASRTSTIILPDRSVQTIYPPNGKFDVVVVQSTLENAFPEGAGILVGKPIYTVYLHVGSGKDWILQYCAAASAVSTQPHWQVVDLGDSSGIQPPYPISTTIPFLEPHAKYLLVHGVLGANGRFRNLKLASNSGRISQQDLFRYLETWTFRPVTQAAQPIDVDTLLAIPPT